LILVLAEYVRSFGIGLKFRVFFKPSVFCRCKLFMVLRTHTLIMINCRILGGYGHDDHKKEADDGGMLLYSN
jgi:hypothetical protein